MARFPSCSQLPNSSKLFKIDRENEPFRDGTRSPRVKLLYIDLKSLTNSVNDYLTSPFGSPIRSATNSIYPPKKMPTTSDKVFPSPAAASTFHKFIILTLIRTYCVKQSQKKPNWNGSLDKLFLKYWKRHLKLSQYSHRPQSSPHYPKSQSQQMARHCERNKSCILLMRVLQGQDLFHLIRHYLHVACGVHFLGLALIRGWVLPRSLQ